MDIRIQLRTHCPVGYPTGKPDSLVIISDSQSASQDKK